MEAGQEVVTKDQVPSVPLMQAPAIPPQQHSGIIFLDYKLGGHHFDPVRFPALLRAPNHWRKLISPPADSPVEHRQPGGGVWPGSDSSIVAGTQEPEAAPWTLNTEAGH